MAHAYKVAGEWRLVLTEKEAEAIVLARDVCCWVSQEVKPKGQFLIAAEQLSLLIEENSIWVETKLSPFA